MTSYSYGDKANDKKEISTIYSYDIKRDDGIILNNVLPDRIIEVDKPLKFPFDYIDTNIKVYLGNNANKNHPYAVWDYLIKLVGYYKHHEEKERKAKKEANIALWKKIKTDTETMLETLKKDWYDWEISNLNNFVFARLVTGETEEEQHQRLEVWSKNSNWRFDIPREIKGFEDNTQSPLDIEVAKLEEATIVHEAENTSEPTQTAIKEAIEVMEMSLEFSNNKAEMQEAIEVLEMLLEESV
jgi:hypothetical protein